MAGFAEIGTWYLQNISLTCYRRCPVRSLTIMSYGTRASSSAIDKPALCCQTDHSAQEVPPVYLYCDTGYSDNFLVAFLSPAGKCPDNTSTTAQPHPSSKSATIQPSNHPPLHGASTGRVAKYLLFFILHICWQWVQEQTAPVTARL